MDNVPYIYVTYISGIVYTSKENVWRKFLTEATGDTLTKQEIAQF